jgi:hypothetical protein
MGAPSNETEAETLRRRQVEALERIAKVLEVFATAVSAEDDEWYPMIRVINTNTVDGFKP